MQACIDSVEVWFQCSQHLHLHVLRLPLLAARNVASDVWWLQDRLTPEHPAFTPKELFISLIVWQHATSFFESWITKCCLARLGWVGQT